MASPTLLLKTIAFKFHNLNCTIPFLSFVSKPCIQNSPVPTFVSQTKMKQKINFLLFSLYSTSLNVITPRTDTRNCAYRPSISPLFSQINSTQFCTVHHL